MSSTGLTYGKVGVYKIDTPHQLYKRFVFVCVWSCEVESGEKGKKEHLYCSLSVRVWIVFWRNTKTDWTFLYRQLVTEGKENREEKMRWLLVHATSTVLWNFCLPVHLNSITPLYIYYWKSYYSLLSLVRLERDSCAQVLHVAHTFASAVYLVMMSYIVVHIYIYVQD